MSFAPTAQQADFLSALTDTDNNLALIARAGCGKTSTILMGVDALVAANPASEILICAFNKAIADEVGGKLKRAGHTNWKTVQTSTLHGLGLSLLKYPLPPKVDAKKVDLLIKAHNEPIYSVYRAQIRSLVGYAKGAAFGFFAQIGDKHAWYELADHFDVNNFEDTSDMDAVIEAAQLVYRESLDQTDVIDFDDMILFPLVKNLRVRFGKDIIFVDEAQDLSPARQALIRKFIKPHTGRMIIVGDDRQAIYGFSGADAKALPNMVEALDATVLPLSVTWRCPKAVVEVAQRFVPDIEAAPEAPEGEVLYLDAMPDDLVPGDAILCRNTAPLIDLAYGLIRQGKAAYVEGRAIGEGLKQLARRWKITTTAALSLKLEVYKDREIQKAMAKGNDHKVIEIEDRVETMSHIIAATNAAGRTSIDDVIQFIDNLFADDVRAGIVLATYHRSKGREWQRVFLYDHGQRCPAKGAKQAWQKQQEANLAYVAITRAQHTLVFVG